jgi:hypothetical protein
MSAYLAKIITGMTPKQRDAVLSTAAAVDGRVPYAVHRRTLDALYSKKLLREVRNRRGGFNWFVLSFLGKRIAAELEARIDKAARKAGILPYAEAVAALKDDTPAPKTAGTVLLAALTIHGIEPERHEYAYAVPLTIHGHALFIADRAPMTEHAPEEHTGWVIALYDGDGAPVDGLRPLYSSGNGTERVDCLTDSAAAAAAIANFLPDSRPGAILGATLAARGIPFHVEADPTWGELLVVDLDRIGGTGTLEIADRSHSLFHPVDEHTGWSIFRKDANGEFVPPTCAPVFISGDGETPVDLFEDTENAIEFIENVAFRQ